MANLVSVEIVAVDREVWSGDVEMVLARTTDGEIGILAGHVPLLGALAEGGIVRLMEEGGAETKVAVHGGFLSVTNEGVQILAELAELESEIDVARAQRQLDEAQGDQDSDEGQARVLRATARLRAAGQAV
ncbi:MAG: F-type H+-transporting ATPase subunit epsilon [Frankiaceae bacterium]|jgi:F-type H+-transporting ATPase subunit epsilon|nr:F-type H+-transporting ATPase subunit epsilon [Frankiaceae bacterium]MDX6275692.1 F-type H+-transporting ATPase subunit epsilon [Frankiales bacterium]